MRAHWIDEWHVCKIGLLRACVEVSLQSLSFCFMYFRAEECIVRINFALGFNYFVISISTVSFPSPPMVVSME